MKKTAMMVSIRTRILGGFLVFIVLMAALALYAAVSGERSLEASVGKASVFLAEEISKRIKHEIYTRITALQNHTMNSVLQETLQKSNRQFENLSDVAGWIERNEDAWVREPKGRITPFMAQLMGNRLADALRREFIDFYARKHGYRCVVEILVTNKYGAIVAETGKTLHYRQDNRKWWQMVREKGLSMIDVPYGHMGPPDALSIGIGINDESGAFMGAIKAVLTLKGIVREVEIVSKRYETTRVKLISGEGRLIYRTRAFKFMEDVSHEPYFKELKWDEGFFVVKSRGIERLYSYWRARNYRGLPSPGWIVVVEHKTAEVLAPARALKNRIMAASLVLILVAVFIAVFIARSITKPIAGLVKGVEEIGRGNLDYRIQLPENDELGQLGLAFNAMLAQRLRGEETLRLSESRFRGFFNSAAIGMAMADLEGRFILVNQSFCEIVGYDDAKLLENSLQTLVHPEDFKGELPLIESLVKGEIAFYQREERLLHKNGSEVWVKVTPSLVRDGEGQPLNLITGIENITELRRHRQHLEQLVEERTIELERSNQELEQFAYVASHDLQEPLRKVQAFGDRFVARYGEHVDERGRDYLARMQGAGRRMAAMIQDLLSLSRVTTQGETFVPVNLREEVQKVLSDLEVAIDECGGLFEIGELPIIEADPSQIHQLMQNLLSNAFKYRKAGATPLVKIDAVITDSHGPEGGRMCRIHVEDNGIGFDEKYTDRIFQPFQRLHGRSEYQGTGIGLAVCRKIVERHGGSIAARSEPGRGATFIVTLPANQQKETSKDG